MQISTKYGENICTHFDASVCLSCTLAYFCNNFCVLFIRGWTSLSLLCFVEILLPQCTRDLGVYGYRYGRKISYLREAWRK